MNFIKPFNKLRKLHTVSVLIFGFLITGCATQSAQYNIPMMSDYDLCASYQRYSFINVNQQLRTREIAKRGLDCESDLYNGAGEALLQRQTEEREAAQAEQRREKSQASQPVLSGENLELYNKIFSNQQSKATNGFKIAASPSCNQGLRTVYKYRLVDRWEVGTDLIVYLSRDVVSPDIVMAAVSSSANADIVVSGETDNADMVVCKSNSLIAKKVLITQDQQYAYQADVKVKLVSSIPYDKSNFYLIYVDESDSNPFTAPESVGIAPAIWELNRR